jgi:hypothetical protein
MRIARTAKLSAPTALQLFSAVVSTPALHARHRKHSTCWSLLHALQSTASAVVDAPDAGVTQNVAFTASNLQYAGGLQQPDCTYGPRYRECQQPHLMLVCTMLYCSPYEFFG